MGNGGCGQSRTVPPSFSLFFLVPACVLPIGCTPSQTPPALFSSTRYSPSGSSVSPSQATGPSRKPAPVWIPLHGPQLLPGLQCGYLLQCDPPWVVGSNLLHQAIHQVLQGNLSPAPGAPPPFLHLSFWCLWVCLPHILSHSFL